jgi:hypothetical protein
VGSDRGSNGSRGLEQFGLVHGVEVLVHHAILVQIVARMTHVDVAADVPERREEGDVLCGVAVEFV